MTRSSLGRAANRARQWVTRRVNRSRDDGFVLLETLVAMGLITVVMAAFTSFFVNSVTSTNHQRARQAAAQIADATVETIRSLPTSTLRVGHNLIPAIAATLTLNNIAYSVNDDLSTCIIPRSAASGSSAACATGTSATDITYMRAVVTINWRDSGCLVTQCAYTTATLLNQGTDACFYSAQPTTQLTVIPPPGTNPVTWTSQVWTFGSTRSLQLAASTGGGNLAWAVIGGALPAGLYLTPAGLISGLISGSPLQVATSGSVTIRVTDGCGQTAPVALTWSLVAAPTIAIPDQTTLINTLVNLDLTQPQGQRAPYIVCPNAGCTYTMTNGPAVANPATPAVPLTVPMPINSTTGVISATPVTAGTVTVTVTVTDSDGVTATDTFTWTILAPATVCALPSALVNGGFEAPGGLTGAPNWQIGGSSPVLWDTTEPDNILELWGNGSNAQSANGGIPITAQNGTQWAELNANQTGALYQNLATVPGQVLQWSVWHRARAVGGSTAGKDVMQVQIGSTTSQAPQVPTGQTTAMISDDASGWNHYTGVYTVPAGQTTTRYQFAAITTASGDNSVGNFIDNLSLNNNIGCLLLAVPPQTSTVNTAITPLAVAAYLDPSSGSGTFEWKDGGTLPAGLSISKGGLITGTPTVIANTPVVLTFTDTQTSFSQTVSFPWTVTRAPTVTSPGNQTTTVNTAVNVPVGGFSCPNAPCTYTVSTLPAGLNINSTTGTISGTPTTVGGPITITITITDKSGAATPSATFTWTVVGSALVVTNPGTQNSTRGTQITQLQMTATGGSGTYAWTGGASLPAGLNLGSGGLISGAPTAAGTTTVTLTVTSGTTQTVTFTWTVVNPPLVVTNPGTQNSTRGTQITQLQMTATGGSGTYAWTGSASLPAGLTLGSGGLITGAPTTAGTTTVTLTVTSGTTQTVTFTWNVAYPALVATNPGAQASTVGKAITAVQLTASGGSGTYAWTGAGTLPAGLGMTSGGRITGTPTTASTPSVTLTVTDATAGYTQNITLTWTVYPRPTVTAPANQATANNAAVNLTVTATCPNTPCVYILNGGPAGLSITSGGVITGTVTSAPQTFTGVTVTVTDAAGSATTSASFTWTVTAPLVGHWTFDEASGSTAADTGSGNHTATLSGGYGKTTSEVVGTNALTTNGTNAAASTSAPALNTSTSFTVAAWVRLTSISGFQTIVSQDGAQLSGFFLQLRGDTGKFGFVKYASDSTSAALAIANAVSAPVAGQWYHLAGVYDSTAATLSLYVNGVLQQTTPATTAWNATGNLAIGRGKYSGASTDWVAGSIDDVRAYSSALSSDAVAQIAQAGYWDLDDGSGKVANDGSLNNADGTLSGGTTWTQGVVGPSAVQFDGTTGVIASNAQVIDTSQSYSVTAWAKADVSDGTYRAVASIDGTNVSGFALAETPSGTWAMIGAASDTGNPALTTAGSGAAVVVGQWYQLVGVYDGVAKTLTLYVNGVKQGLSQTYTGWEAAGPFIIGRAKFSGSPSLYFDGAMDDVHAYQFPLDQTAISALAASAPPTPAAPTASAGAAAATVNWVAPATIAGNPVTGYVVTPYLSGIAQTPLNYRATPTTQTLSGLTPGGSYTFTVTAVNANGNSSPSAQSAAVVPT